MLTAAGCRDRRLRLMERIADLHIDKLFLADPLHVRYLANAYVTPFSLGGDALVVLEIHKDGSAILHHDNRVPDSLSAAFVDLHAKIPWYDGRHTPTMPRQLALKKLPHIPHDAIGQPTWERITKTIADMRRHKDADEIATLHECCRVAEAGHDWALYNLSAGMSEMDVYTGVSAVCERVADTPIVVYGDFAVSPGPERRGGGPSAQVLKNGDLFILDFSVVLRGYRCDFTNTLCVGGEPNREQLRLMTLSKEAMAAGEAKLKCGTLCQAVFDAVMHSFEVNKVGDHFPHHAGHGIGLAHPEPPYFVRQSVETLREGDVVTLEPGLYMLGIGGLRIEHNYLITKEGFERMSRHKIALLA